MQIISNIALISINETLFVQLISFLIFLFLINRIMFRPLVSEMNKRDSYIEGIQQDIISANQNLDALQKQLKTRELETKKEALALKLELEEKGALDAFGIIEIARNEGMVIKSRAEAEVEVKILAAQKFCKKESEVLALEIMEKVLERRLAC